MYGRASGTETSTEQYQLPFVEIQRISGRPLQEEARQGEIDPDRSGYYSDSLYWQGQRQKRAEPWTLDSDRGRATGRFALFHCRRGKSITGLQLVFFSETTRSCEGCLGPSEGAPRESHWIGERALREAAPKNCIIAGVHGRENSWAGSINVSTLYMSLALRRPSTKIRSQQGKTSQSLNNSGHDAPCVCEDEQANLCTGGGTL